MVPTRVRSLALAAVAVLLALAPSGCLEFEEQEVAWAYNPDHDRLDVQLVYRGIHVSADARTDAERDAALATAGRQLDQVRAGRRLFALQQSFPLGFDLDEIAEGEATALEKALIDRIAIDQGDFFRAADGRLCGWQRLRISGFTEFVQLLDRQLRLSIVEPKAREEFLASFGLKDAASRARVAHAIEQAGAFLSHQDGLLVLRVPASEAEARSWVARWLPPPSGPDAATVARVEEHAPDRHERDVEFTLSFLRWLGAQAVATTDGIEITLGDPAHPAGPAASPRLPRPPNALPPADDVAPLLLERRMAIRTDVTEDALARDFAEFRRH